MPLDGRTLDQPQCGHHDGSSVETRGETEEDVGNEFAADFERAREDWVNSRGEPQANDQDHDDQHRMQHQQPLRGGITV